MRALLALVLMLVGLGCCTIPQAPQDPIEAIATLGTNAVIRIDGTNSKQHFVCTGLYMGSGRFLTAGHCAPDGASLASHGQPLTLLKIDRRRDLALVSITDPSRHSIEALRTLQALPPCAAQLPTGRLVVGLGFPGYFGTDYSIEVSHFKRYATAANGVLLLLTTDAGFPGMSGGPIVDVKAQCVAGMIDALNPQSELDNKSITLAIATSEIQAFLSEP